MRFELDVRYSECDMQQVVHNSVYLRWCDDLADSWFRQVIDAVGPPGALAAADTSGRSKESMHWRRTDSVFLFPLPGANPHTYAAPPPRRSTA